MIPKTGQRTALAIVAAVATGMLLRHVVSLAPTWWLAWLAPIPLLLLAFSYRPWPARALVLLAALIGSSVNLAYLHLVMPLPAAIGAVLGQALIWMAIAMTTRAVVRRYDGAWVVLVYPALWVAVDTLMASWLPDGNWGSLAYSQSEVLALLQVASLFGVSGILFLLCLLPSTAAVFLWRGGELRYRWLAATATAGLLCAGLGFGWWQLRVPGKGMATRVGMASIDDPIGLEATPHYAQAILAQYDIHVGRLSQAGATIVVLPEKIAVLSPGAAARWKSHFSAIARQNDIWLEVGIAIAGDGPTRNLSWLFDPRGVAVENYQKQKLAPPERRDHYADGADFAVHVIDQHKVGLAICKDMHFASLGRGYAQRGAAAMLVPAWDFAYLDGWLEARTTVTRGVEGDYAVIRAAREGLLTVSDARGRVIAERPSAPMPGATLLAQVHIGEPVPTLYTRIGNLLGWLCVGLAGFFILLSRRSQGVAVE